MQKLILIHQEREVRSLLNDHLSNCGYDVKEVSNADAGLELVLSEGFDGVLLDTQLPSAGSWRLLAKLKEDARSRFIPVVMLTSYLSNEEESIAMRMGASHFISRPWKRENIELTIRVALRDSQKEAQKQLHSFASLLDDYPLYHPAPEITTGFGSGGKLRPLEEALSGGVTSGSLTLVEGDTGTGKSVLSQYLIDGAILGGRRVEFFSTEHTVGSLGKQMSSLGMSVSDYLRDDTIGVYRIPTPSEYDDPANLLATLALHVGRVQPGNRLTIIDGISVFVQISPDRAVIDFFINLDRMCREGRTIVLTARLSCFDEHLLNRLHGVCDNLISLSREIVRDRMINTIEVPKVDKVEKNRGCRFSFRVEPQGGIKIIPIERVKV